MRSRAEMMGSRADEVGGGGRAPGAGWPLSMEESVTTRWTGFVSELAAVASTGQSVTPRLLCPGPFESPVNITTCPGVSITDGGDASVSGLIRPTNWYLGGEARRR